MNGTGRLAFVMTARMLAYLLIVTASAAIFVATAHAQDLCSNPLYLDPVAGEDAEGCGTEDAPCGTLSYVATLALSCSAQLGEEITIMQYTGPDYLGEIAVGLANPTGLADEPFTIGFGEDATAEEAEAVSDAEAETGAEAVTTESEAGSVDETEETAAAEGEEGVAGEEAAEESGFPWTVSRTSALYSVLALFLGIIIGVVMSYGMNSGDSGKKAATVAAVLLALGAAFIPATAWAQAQCPGEFAFFAPETGQDVEACGTAETPCQTFEYAIAQAEACPHGVTIYQNETPIFLLELSSDLADAGENTVSEIGESASNIEVADEADEGGAIEEAAEEVAAEAVEAVSEASELTEEAVEGVLNEPVGDIDDWIWWIGMAALGVVLGYAAHALPAAKLDS